MKILKAQKHPDVKHNIINIPLDEILLIAGENWLYKKMIKYGYEDSFKNAGMVFPITTVYSKDYWLPRRLHSEGLYVVTGHNLIDFIQRGYMLSQATSVYCGLEQMVILISKDIKLII